MLWTGAPGGPAEGRRCKSIAVRRAVDGLFKDMADCYCTPPALSFKYGPE
jgi:hypothetical protein